MIWFAVSDEDCCGECGAPLDCAHLLGCSVGEEILRECLADEADELAIDEAKGDAHG